MLHAPVLIRTLSPSAMTKDEARPPRPPYRNPPAK